MLYRLFKGQMTKKIFINTAYCDNFLGNTPRNLIWNNIDYILYNVVRRAIATRFDLAQGSHQATCTKKETLQYTEKIILVFLSRMNSKTAQQNTVKVSAAQFSQKFFCHCYYRNIRFRINSFPKLLFICRCNIAVTLMQSEVIRHFAFFASTTK